MLERLEQSFRRLSQFSADIAHELRTTVNNLRGELDVALERRRNPEEYEEALGSSLEECDRLTRLIESLLFLARAEDPRTQIEQTPCSLPTDLTTIHEFLERRAHESGVRIEVEAPAGLEADLNRPLFQRAVGILIDNALAYTSSVGAIAVRGRGADETLQVEVADTG